MNREAMAPQSKDQRIALRIHTVAQVLANEVVRAPEDALGPRRLDLTLDNVLTSPWFGFPIMMLGLGVVFWLTISGANVPGEYLAAGLFWVEDVLSTALLWLGTPVWLHDFLVLGLYRGMAWVVAVMLPPMAIFFPLFTLLEDFGYLPRVAFNMDRVFKAVGAHGKQALTMAMGFGCNAAAVLSTRIIESPRERMLAILTNNFVPCNGRWPTLIIMSTLFVGGAVGAGLATAAASATVVALVLFGIFVTLGVSWLLSRTLLRGVPSAYSMELPPYRKPLIGQVLIRSVYDRTIKILIRAVKVAAPAGAITWILANTHVGELSLLPHSAQALDPVARALGMDGFILMAFILGLPANEIVLPIMIMGYVQAGAMLELDSLDALKTLLVDQHGWTWVTALCTMLFSLLHYPCGTTIYTIYRETQSPKWATLSAVIPLSLALAVTFAVNQLAQLLGLV